VTGARVTSRSRAVWPLAESLLSVLVERSVARSVRGLGVPAPVGQVINYIFPFLLCCPPGSASDAGVSRSPRACSAITLMTFFEAQ
jgi:hypothetical protein